MSDRPPISILALVLSVVVGAHENFTKRAFAGAVYVFRPDAAGSWRQVAKLTTDDAQDHDRFGCSVAISGTRIAVGSAGREQLSGTAFVFDCDERGGWRQVAKCTPSGLCAVDRFGAAIALSGGRLLVGSPMNDSAASNAGAAYLFSLDDSG